MSEEYGNEAGYIEDSGVEEAAGIQSQTPLYDEGVMTTELRFPIQEPVTPILGENQEMIGGKLYEVTPENGRRLVRD